MRLRIFIPVFALLGTVLVGCDRAPTSAENENDPSFITDGKLDGNAHPAVVLIIADVGGAPAWRCSGTLIAPTVVLTAGHCTEAPGVVSGMRVFTESDVQNGTNNYPFAGPNTVEAKDWETHPDFPFAPFFVHDVGLMQLKKAVKLPDHHYGRLPEVDQLDELSPSNATRFTAVGYGLQRINPVFVVAERIRMFAEPHLIQINVPGFTGNFSLLLSNNASTGGTCFGDSGGPNYLGSSNVVAGVTSFGINGNCAGTGGVFRMDRRNVLDFVNTQLTKWGVSLP
jgi:V8-like Glu-specific endopeptidase